ncbi:MAG TPA: serine protease [Planctomycetaceae bacterium]|nr:serine protease [Planctomycetaceae bacterium]
MVSPRMPSAENTLLGQSAAHADDTELPAFLRQRFSIRASNRRDNGDMIQLIRPLAEAIGPSVVQIVSDGTPVSLGTIVSSDGYILTKRSELSGDPIRVRLSDARLLPARVAAVRRQSDLALIRIEGAGSDLQPIKFAKETEAVVGSFLVSVGRTGVPIGLGAVSVRPRTVEHNGRLGVVLVDERGQATVRGVWPDSGAESAGVKQGDQIIAIDDRNETSRNAVIQALRGMFPGESVKLTINREGETLNLIAKIQDFGVMQETENDTKVNGPRSTRLSGFERVLQHDTVLNPDECGGPVIDTSGRVIGMNIARAGRVLSYALPASLVVPEVDSMLAEARGQAGGK